MAANSMLGIFFGPPGMGEMVILAAVGLLIFGKRLPEVGKSLGKGILEFKKGISGVKEELKLPDKNSTSPSDAHEEPPPTVSDGAKEASPVSKPEGK